MPALNDHTDQNQMLLSSIYSIENKLWLVNKSHINRFLIRVNSITELQYKKISNLSYFNKMVSRG